VPAKVKNNYVIRFTITSYYTTKDDIERDWEIIQSIATQILIKLEVSNSIEEQKRKFQSSLLLSNVSQTPKLVNASFLAFTDSDIVYDLVKELTTRDYSQSHLPLIPRRKPKFFLNNAAQKGLSFDQLSLSTPSDFYSSSNNNIDTHMFMKKCSITENGEQEQEENETTNTKLAVNNFIKKQMPMKMVNKQTSLDSKIEYICEEVELENQQNNQQQLNGENNNS
jgi:hypothetical protein